MLAIRFSRKGKKKQPTYRVIINEKTKDTFGDYLENLGNYNPRTKEAVLSVDRIKFWLAKGAQPSASVFNLFVSKGIMEGKKKNVTRMSKKRAANLAAEKAKNEPAPVAAEPTPAAEPVAAEPAK